MERKSLLFQPSGQAASVAPSQIQAPLGAFGGGQGLSDLGQGIANVGSQVSRIQEEKAARAQQDRSLGASASTYFASKVASGKVAELNRRVESGEVGIDDIDEDAFVKDVSKTYNDELHAQLSKRRIPSDYTSSDEFAVKHGGVHDSVAREALSLAANIKETKRTAGQTLVNQASIDNLRATKDWSSSFLALESTAKLKGVSAGARNGLVSSQMEAIELLLPDALDAQQYTDENRKAMQSQMVSLGWSAERAAAVTKRAVLSDTNKTEIIRSIETSARNGDVAAVASSIAKLAPYAVPAEVDRIRGTATARLHVHQITSAVTRPSPESPFLSYSGLGAQEDKLAKDPSGYTVLQQSLESQGITNVDQDVLRSGQSEILSAIKARRELIRTSPMEAIMTDSAVAKSAQDVTSALADSINTNGGLSDKLLGALDTFRSASARAAGRMEIEASLVTPVPPSIADPILTGLSNKASAPAAASLFLGFVNMGNKSGVGSEVGRALSLGIVDRASKHDDENVRKLAPALLVAQNLSLSGGANSAAAVNRILQSALDPARTASAKKSLVEMRMSDDFSKSKIPVSPAKIVQGALYSMSPGTSIDTGIASTISGVFSSYAKDQTLDRLASATSNMAAEAGIKIDKAQMTEFFSDWITTDAASSGGSLTERGIMGSAGSLASLFTSAGVVAASMDGQEYLVQHNITDTSIYSLFGVTKEASTTSLSQMPAAAQALMDVNGVIRDRASLDFRISENGGKVDRSWGSKAGIAAAGIFGMGLGGLIAEATTSSPQGTPADKLQAHTARLWSNFSDTNFTFLFTGNHVVGDLDIEAHFYPQEVLKEFGFVSDNPDKGMNRPRFEANTRWFPNLDGSMSKHWITGTTAAIGNKVDASTIKKGDIVSPDATIPRADVDAALLYITLQGTRAQESFNNQYEQDAYEPYAEGTNYAVDPADVPGLRLKAGRTAPTSEELNVAFARHIRNLVANRSAQNGTNHTRKPPAKPTVRSAPAFYDGGSVPLSAPPSSTSVQFDPEQDR